MQPDIIDHDKDRSRQGKAEFTINNLPVIYEFNQLDSEELHSSRNYTAVDGVENGSRISDLSVNGHKVPIEGGNIILSSNLDLAMQVPADNAYDPLRVLKQNPTWEIHLPWERLDSLLKLAIFYHELGHQHDPIEVEQPELPEINHDNNIIIINGPQAAVNSIIFSDMVVRSGFDDLIQIVHTLHTFYKDRSEAEYRSEARANGYMVRLLREHFGSGNEDVERVISSVIGVNVIRNVLKGNPYKTISIPGGRHIGKWALDRGLMAMVNELENSNTIIPEINPDGSIRSYMKPIAELNSIEDRKIAPNLREQQHWAYLIGKDDPVYNPGVSFTPDDSNIVNLEDYFPKSGDILTIFDSANRELEYIIEDMGSLDNEDPSIKFRIVSNDPYRREYSITYEASIHSFNLNDFDPYPYIVTPDNKITKINIQPRLYSRDLLSRAKLLLSELYEEMFPEEDYLASYMD